MGFANIHQPLYVSFLENATGVCPIVLSPVCGEDVIEYDNDCLSKCDGVEKKCKGPCPFSVD